MDLLAACRLGSVHCLIGTLQQRFQLLSRTGQGDAEAARHRDLAALVGEKLIFDGDGDFLCQQHGVVLVAILDHDEEHLPASVAHEIRGTGIGLNGTRYHVQHMVTAQMPHLSSIDLKWSTSNTMSAKLLRTRSFSLREDID